MYFWHLRPIIPTLFFLTLHFYLKSKSSEFKQADMTVIFKNMQTNRYLQITSQWQFTTQAHKKIEKQLNKKKKKFPQNGERELEATFITHSQLISMQMFQ